MSVSDIPSNFIFNMDNKCQLYQGSRTGLFFARTPLTDYKMFRISHI